MKITGKFEKATHSIRQHLVEEDLQFRRERWAVCRAHGASDVHSVADQHTLVLRRLGKQFRVLLGVEVDLALRLLLEDEFDMVEDLVLSCRRDMS